MKKHFLIAGLFLSLLLAKPAGAQVNVNINIGAQPVWGPVGYDYVEYYYLPEWEVYYYVPSRRFVYLDGGNWVFAAGLPPRFGHVDVFTTYKVVVNQPRAYVYFDDHRVKYAKFRKARGGQVIIRDSDDPRYYVVKGHPKHVPPGQLKKQDKGKGKGHGKKKG
ncbi:MAG: hypothetical protein AAB316_18095 [Bacteroidota bacterium]